MPVIFVTEADRRRLAPIAQSSAGRGGAILGDELARAVVLREADGPHVFVRLNSVVEFTDLFNGRQSRVVLVSPEEADPDEGRLSVASPVGASLLGLLPGESIAVSGDDGRPQVLVVSSVQEAGRGRGRRAAGSRSGRAPAARERAPRGLPA
jgi:regulator of nucleoside diphosphate kinase